jgi:hypothetical protein
VAGTLLGLVLIAAAPSQPIRFEQFAVSKTFTGEAASPNLASHPRARTYRTVLRTEAKSGANFAGHFTVVRIGAGTGTILLAVVDALSGAVYFPKHPALISWAGWWHDPYGPVYRIDSRLLIVYGRSGSEDAPYGISYFEWTGHDFKLLHFEPRDRGAPYGLRRPTPNVL